MCVCVFACVVVCAYACVRARMRQIKRQSERDKKDKVREKRDIGVCDTSSLHIRLLQLMHKWVRVSLTPCVLVGAWERRCCQPAFECISAHVSLFKRHMLVIWWRRTYGAEQNRVTLLVHCHIHRANIRSHPCRPHPITPLFSFCHLPRSAGMEEQL